MAQSSMRSPASQTTGTTPRPCGPKARLVVYGGNVGGSLPVTQTGKQSPAEWPQDWGGGAVGG